MKNFVKILIVFVMMGTAVLSFAGSAFITNTKHNLSKNALGVAIKSGTETEICVFCHIPHGARPSVPLWSHEMTASAYTSGQLYDSDYLYRFGYNIPTTLGSLPNEAGYLSRLCLSCHDGTVALGSIHMLRGITATPGTPIIGDVSGTGTTGGYLTASSSSFLGTNLRDDHPIAIEYDPTKTKAFGSGTRGIELNNTAPSITPSPYTGVKLFKPSGGNVKGHVECTSCHDPHNDTNGQFLTAGKLNGALCTTCHQKVGWSAGIHKTSTVAIDNSGDNSSLAIPGSTIAEASCLACHKSHSGSGTPYLLRKIEENSCFNGTSASCHGASATAGNKKIESVFTKTYKHPATTISGKHTNLDVLYPTTLYATGDTRGVKGLGWGADVKHSECVDCHNPHKASNTPARLLAGSWYPSSVDSTSNQISKSGALPGVTGIEPGWAGTSTTYTWVQASSYTTYESSVYEYQICLKCHSSYALGTASSTPVSGYQSLSDPTNVYFTDVAWEINPRNMSGHPVMTGLNNFYNSSIPKLLTAGQMKAPWNINVGTQTMYCSDCHGADSETGTDSRGPHASNRKFMLKGTGQYWPKKSDGTTYWKLSDWKAGATDLFCNNCHASSNEVHAPTANNTVHDNYLCVNCHVAVPHGAKRSRLIGYSSEVMPYNDNNTNALKIQGFRKASSPTNYVKADCNTSCHVVTNPGTPNCGGFGCDP
ncbi:MAG: cytochrome C [Nitrospirae bacterium]|nr:MAG: cytochrome C [Nitrospirota bacterium]